MSPGNDSSKADQRLADRLAAGRRRHFVGREAELELFRSALKAEEPPFAVLFLYGPGGIGKSTLLQEYARLAEAHGRSSIMLDGRNVEPSPAGFREALQLALNVPEDKPLPADFPPKLILLIDTYERIRPLDRWLRNEFLPQLPTDALVIIAGRYAPRPAWRSDPGWADLTRIVSLRNLRPEESQTFLAARGIPEEQQAGVLAFTHGHPLALSLVADVLNQGGGAVPFNSEDELNVVPALLDRFTQNVPDGQHRQALEIAAHVRVTTEALLANTLENGEAHRLFAWLRELSFMERGRQGLFPHDLAREVLEADLRWRNPQAYLLMNQRVRTYYDKLLLESEGRARRLAMTDITYLYRHNPLTKSYYDWDALGAAHTEPATAEDQAAILEMVQHHEGSASAEIAQYWLQRQPDAFNVFRGNEDKTIGFMAMLKLAAITATDAATDPAMAAAQRFIQSHGPLRPEETLDYVRFVMGRESYQSADINNLVTEVAGTVYRSGGPSRAYSFSALADPERWKPFFAFLNFDYAQEAGFTVAGRRFGVFFHDWRAEPVLVWSRIIGERQVSDDPEAGRATAADVPLVVLSEPDFYEAVRQALRDYRRPDLLSANPLARSRLVVETAGREGAAAALQSLLEQAAAALTGNPRDEKFYRALHHTYYKPAPTQEAAAELLDLPLGTYRYRLARGVERVSEWLWQRELRDLSL